VEFNRDTRLIVCDFELFRFVKLNIQAERKPSSNYFYFGIDSLDVKLYCLKLRDSSTNHLQHFYGIRNDIYVPQKTSIDSFPWEQLLRSRNVRCWCTYWTIVVTENGSSLHRRPQCHWALKRQSNKTSTAAILPVAVASVSLCLQCSGDQ